MGGEGTGRLQLLKRCSFEIELEGAKRVRFEVKKVVEEVSRLLLKKLVDYCCSLFDVLVCSHSGTDLFSTLYSLLLQAEGFSYQHVVIIG
jgi:hypothetical protein